MHWLPEGVWGSRQFQQPDYVYTESGALFFRGGCCISSNHFRHPMDGEEEYHLPDSCLRLGRLCGQMTRTRSGDFEKYYRPTSLVALIGAAWATLWCRRLADGAVTQKNQSVTLNLSRQEVRFGRLCGAHGARNVRHGLVHVSAFD